MVGGQFMFNGVRCFGHGLGCGKYKGYKQRAKVDISLVWG